MQVSPDNLINRRKFVELSVSGAVGAGLATIPLVASTGCYADNIKTIHGARYLDCHDRCSRQMKVSKGEITEFKASSDNPYTTGKLCNKMDNFPNDIAFNPNRILLH